MPTWSASKALQLPLRTSMRAAAWGSVPRRLGRHPVFEQGKLMKSGGPFDLAIDGAGFFAVEKNGATAYTRAGEFSRSADGTLRNADGWALRGVHIPADAFAASVERDGRVVVDTAALKHRVVARVHLAAFRAPEMLRPLGGTIFAQTSDSGAPQSVTPGQRPVDDRVRHAREIERLDRRVDDADPHRSTRL